MASRPATKEVRRCARADCSASFLIEARKPTRYCSRSCAKKNQWADPTSKIRLAKTGRKPRKRP